MADEKEEKPKLKPCPFCMGEHPQITSDGGCQSWKVFCTNNCSCTMSAPYDNDNEDGAIAAWNNRVILSLEE